MTDRPANARTPRLLKAVMAWTCLAIAAPVLAAPPAADAPKPAAPPSPLDVERFAFFNTEVRPILLDSCIKCHGGEKVKGELNMTSRAGLLKGGDTGPAVVPERPLESLLLKAISYADDNLLMPPKEKLPADKIAVLTKWVTLGAHMPPDAFPGLKTAAPEHVENPLAGKVTPEAMKFWSFVPVAKPVAPDVKDKAWVKSPIDAFVLAKLEANQLRPAPPANKIALLRRAYYDLTGLPPKSDEVEAFVADASPDAFAKVVDRLLASPQYGEKWGRHWLDLVRFAETNSFERDGIKPNAWRFRDYVIDAFNTDKPYDQFVREQIAGDELDKVTHESIIATGFYRLGQWDDEPSDRVLARYDELDDIVTTVSQGFLGLTINCARCHDHKIDPVTARDYYSLVAVFNNIAPYGKGDSTMVDIPMPGRNAALDQELKGVEQRLADLKGRVDAFEVKAIAAMSPAERKKFDRFNKPDRAKALEQKVLETTNADDARLYKGLVRQYTELERDKHKSVPKAMAVKETGPKPADTFLLKRGNPQSPGEKVAPAFPAVLQPPALTPAAPKPDQKSTGLRRQLANWLTDAKNPLPARVMANRIWQHHFGRGIVRSPNDFGVNGDRPTHPELLDYLASEFVTRNWSVKAMHRLIMLSSTYQMSADADKNALAKDPLNNLLWRFDMRRLTAEEIRDSILALNGKLNLKMGGPGIFPTIPAAILAGQSRPGEGWGRNTPEEASRRSVYIHVKRSLVVPIITAFDGADTDFSCPSRFQTTQSTQALMMLNSDMINDEARALAARLKKQAGDDPRKQVEMALRLALSRTPEEQEISRGVDFIARLQAKHKASPETALNQFALLVLNLNEFVYVD